MRTQAIALTIAIALVFPLTSTVKACSEEVSIDVLDGSIAVRHEEARFNCCAWIDTEVIQEGFEIGILEYERFEAGPCYCQCCFAVATTVSGLSPGDYSVSVWKLYDNFDGTWTPELVGTWIVTVTGYAEPFVESTYLPCVETAVPEEPGSWGVIKSLYNGR